MITKLAILVFAFILIPILNTHAAETAIPDWIKNNAGWWAEGEIDDNSFVSGIQWLISNGIMSIPPTEQGTGSDGIPTWIKNNAGWWAEGEIDDNSFVSGIQWLISNGIIVIEQPESQQVVKREFTTSSCGSTDEVNIEIKNIPRDPVTLACTNGIVKCAEIEFVRPLDNFYEKCTTDSGMIVASSAVVPDEALYEMNRIILEMTQLHPEATERINALGIIAGVIGVDQGTTDMPEYKDLKNDPNVDWDERARGLGATIFRPLVSAGEENLLCYTSDRYRNGQPGGESIGVHEISHTILDYGLISSSMDPDWYSKSYWPGGQVLFNDLIAIYEEARNEGRWHDTYGGSNWAEFFAIGTQIFFDANDRSDDYGFNMNREGLEQYEPKLVDYFETIYPVSWSYSCP